MTAYYNEFDPFAAAWLRELITDGLIAPGDVDDRSITEVRPADLVGYTQCHFFAGIGGWSYALRLAGWPDDRSVWTGSCPCQPYSGAGKGEGATDSRNLWPVWFPLLAECRPDRVFGEQVASAIGHGWLDAVSTDLEAEGYAVGAVVLGAHSVGAPHLRQRLYWVADAQCGSAERRGHDMGAAASGTQGEARERERLRADAGAGEPTGGLGHAERTGLRISRGADADQPDEPGHRALSTWADPQWLPCRDGKARPTQSGIFPLAHGVPNRVGTLRGAGNSIVSQVAAAFICAYLES